MDHSFHIGMIISTFLPHLYDIVNFKPKALMVLPLGFFPKNLIPIGCYCFSGFSSGIHQNIQKAQRFGECASVLGNYSISELKLCRNLTSI